MTISAVNRVELLIAQSRAMAIYSRYSRAPVKPTPEEVASGVRKMEQIVEEIHRKLYSPAYGHTLDLIG